MRHTSPNAKKIQSVSCSGKKLMLRKVTIGIVGFLSMPFFATADFVPTYDTTSGYLNSATTEVFTNVDGYLEFETPTGNTCRIGEGVPGYTWGVGDAGSLGASGSFATYIDGSGAHSTICSPGITDYSSAEDGTWILRTYDDDAFSNVLDTFTFCQGASCSAPPPPSPSTSTTTAVYPDLPFQGTVIFFLTFWTILFIIGAWKSSH